MAATSKFVQGLLRDGATVQTHHLRRSVAEIEALSKAMGGAVDAFKHRHQALGATLSKIDPAERVDVLGVANVEVLATDPIRICDMADEIIRQAHRLKELASRELCEDWTETHLRAAVEVLGGAA